jgi:lysine 2,3-aminomutase
VPDEKWNDWRWQMSNRLNTIDELSQVINLTEEEREGISAEGPVPH